MTLIDTHVWVWWITNSPRLSAHHRALIAAAESAGLGVSAITVWEVAKLFALGRLALSPAFTVSAWIEMALAYPGVRLLPLTPAVAIEANNLPGRFHRDPADQIIVATARIFDRPLLTVDERILDYPHVRAVGPNAPAA